MNTTIINYDQVRKAQLVIRAIENPVRKQIIETLKSQPSITVTELYVKLRLEQSVCSQYLHILRFQKIVKTERAGKNIYYSLNTDRLKMIQQLVEQF